MYQLEYIQQTFSESKRNFFKMFEKIFTLLLNALGKKVIYMLFFSIFFGSVAKKGIVRLKILVGMTTKAGPPPPSR